MYPSRGKLIKVLDSWTEFLPGKITEWYGKIEKQ